MMLVITTKYGNQYFIDQKGQITYPGYNTPSGKWLLLGLDHVKKNYFIPFTDLWNKNFPEPLLYKNGNPQWTIRDLDHGSIRVWGNTKYHGIKLIYKK